MDKNSDILIEGSTATWDMGLVQGTVQGAYSGTFTFRCFLTPTQSLAASKKYRELLGPQLLLATEHEGYLAWSLTQLEHRVLKAPPFWYEPTQNGEMPGNIPDLNIIHLVMDAAQRAQDKFMGKVVEEKPKLLGEAIGASEKVLEEDANE